VAGEAEKVAMQVLYIQGHMGHGLSAVHQQGRPTIPADLSYLLDGKNSSQGIGDLADCHHPGFLLYGAV